MILLPGGSKFGAAVWTDSGGGLAHTDLWQKPTSVSQPLPLHPGNFHTRCSSPASERSGGDRPAEEDPGSHRSEPLWIPQASVLPHQLELRR